MCLQSAQFSAFPVSLMNFFLILQNTKLNHRLSHKDLIYKLAINAIINFVKNVSMQFRVQCEELIIKLRLPGSF